MKYKIEERFKPPFTYYKHYVSGYVVRPINWAGYHFIRSEEIYNEN